MLSHMDKVLGTRADGYDELHDTRRSAWRAARDCSYWVVLLVQTWLGGDYLSHFLALLGSQPRLKVLASLVFAPHA